MNNYILFGFSYYVFQELGLLVAIGFVILSLNVFLSLYTSHNERHD